MNVLTGDALVRFDRVLAEAVMDLVEVIQLGSRAPANLADWEATYIFQAEAWKRIAANLEAMGQIAMGEISLDH